MCNRNRNMLDISDYEVFHYTSKNTSIFSKKNIVYVSNLNENTVIKLPFNFFDIFSFLRILRRFFRLDKCNVFLINTKPLNLIIIRWGHVYVYNKEGGLIKTLTLKNCRNIMHVDLCRLPNGNLCFGEYGSNNKRKKVPIYISKDNGFNWDIAFEFPENSIKHIHVVKYDSFSQKIWCCTGDKDGENKIVLFDKNFNLLETLGDGSQIFRTCDLFFTEEKVVWLMDSPNEKSHVISYHRNLKVISKGQELIGPVWYSTQLGENLFLAATSVEPGYSMDHKSVELLLSNDLITWKPIMKYKKDILPIDYFKYGVIAFPIGKQDSKSVYYFGEALIDLDGHINKIDLNNYVL